MAVRRRRARTVCWAPTRSPKARPRPRDPVRPAHSRSGSAEGRVPAAHGTMTFPVTATRACPRSRRRRGPRRIGGHADPLRLPDGIRGRQRQAQPSGRRPKPSRSKGQSMTGLVTVPVVNGQDRRLQRIGQAPVNLTADVVGYNTAKRRHRIHPRRSCPDPEPGRRHAGHAHVLTVAGVDGVPGDRHAGGRPRRHRDRPGPGRPPGRLRRTEPAVPAVTSLSFAARQQVTEAGDRPGDRRQGGPRQRLGGLAQADRRRGRLLLGRGRHLPPGERGRGSWTPAPDSAEPEERSCPTRPPSWTRSGTPCCRPAWDRSVLNVTVLGPKSAGTLTAFPDGVLYQDGVKLPNSTSLPGTPNIAFRPARPSPTW